MFSGESQNTFREVFSLRKKEYAIISLCMLGLFALWTAAVTAVDVQAIGPEGSSVGFAGLNGWIHGLTGVHIWLYTLTDWPV